MADNENEEKKGKPTVPMMVRSAKGVADHAAAVQAMQWDGERHVFRDPSTVVLALFAYAKVTAALLDEAEARLVRVNTDFGARLSALEGRVKAFEEWRAEAMRQAKEMSEGFDEMFKGDAPPSLDAMKALLNGEKPRAAQEAVTTAAALLPMPEGAPTVVPLKPDIKPDKARKKPEEKHEEKSERDEKKGGAA